MSRYDFAFCGFPSRVGAASCVDAAHDPEPKALPVASFAVLRCRKWAPAAAGPRRCWRSRTNAGVVFAQASVGIRRPTAVFSGNH
ncbi:hypothetical protein [Burkholderia glumae]|uniref:hypothetical protein n=1 Tax=Burkholderia glumae TaxID=337 RepID=UPI003BA0CA3B